jgi:hypothetical protein
VFRMTTVDVFCLLVSVECPVFQRLFRTDSWMYIWLQKRCLLALALPKRGLSNLKEGLILPQNELTGNRPSLFQLSKVDKIRLTNIKKTDTNILII